jgi:hypothetical protein
VFSPMPFSARCLSVAIFVIREQEGALAATVDRQDRRKRVEFNRQMLHNPSWNIG